MGVHKITSKALQDGDKFSVLLCLERKIFSQEELQAVGLFPKFPLQISLSLDPHIPHECQDWCFPFSQHPEPQQGCKHSKAHTVAEQGRLKGSAAYFKLIFAVQGRIASCVIMHGFFCRSLLGIHKQGHPDLWWVLQCAQEPGPPHLPSEASQTHPVASNTAAGTQENSFPPLKPDTVIFFNVI